MPSNLLCCCSVFFFCKRSHSVQYFFLCRVPFRFLVVQGFTSGIGMRTSYEIMNSESVEWAQLVSWLTVSERWPNQQCCCFAVGLLKCTWMCVLLVCGSYSLASVKCEECIRNDFTSFSGCSLYSQLLWNMALTLSRLCWFSLNQYGPSRDNVYFDTISCLVVLSAIIFAHIYIIHIACMKCL